MELLKDLPAIYATAPAPGTSSSYVFIPTKPVIESLQERGWIVVGAKQTKSRDAERAPFARHMIRLRHETLVNLVDPRNEKPMFPELILVNGHDGSATYRLLAGIFSFVCSNGLIVGSFLDGATIRHTGLKATLEAVNGGAMKIMAEEMPKLMQLVSDMAGRVISKGTQHDFARHALELRYKGLPPVLNTDQLLERHRSDDERDDIWTVLNVIQENVLSRTHTGRSFSGRRSNIRAVKAIKEEVGINRGLWDYAQKLTQNLVG